MNQRHRPPTRSLGLLLTVLLLAVLPTAASAHRASSYYDLRWLLAPDVAGLDTDRELSWAFAPNVDDEARDDAEAAADAWNEHATRLVFRRVDDLGSDPGPTGCPLDAPHPLRRGPIDGPSASGGGILAVAVLCSVPGTALAQHFTITYDDEEPWHFGGEPIPPSLFDLRGILVHEFGHATGWGRHFDETTGPECIAAMRHTMCSTVAPGNPDPRTLEPHDIDTWQDAY